MTSAAPQPRTAAALAARQRTTEAALRQVDEALTYLRRTKAPVTVVAVARRAQVYRTFLYENPQARAAVAEAMTQSATRRNDAQIARDAVEETAWRERAHNAEDALRAAHQEIRIQRQRLAELLGRIRDLEQEWPENTAQRVVTENSALKQQVRQLTRDLRTAEERLQAARSNSRFQDRRIAQLESQLLDDPPKVLKEEV